MTSLALTLNRLLGRPIEAFVDGQWQIGHVHLRHYNGAYNVHEMSNESGGVKGLAYGLSARESYEWLRGAVTAVQLVNNAHSGF